MSRSSSPQLPLPLLGRTVFSWSNFESEANAELVQALQSMDGSRAVSVWIVGPSGSGKTHALLATQHAADQQNSSVQYLDLARLKDQHASWRQIEPAAINLLDNVDVVAGNDQAERALFGLIERIRVNGSAFVAAARHDLSQFTLADLASRLNAGLKFSLHPLTEHGRLNAITKRFESRGLVVDDAVVQFIVTRFSRDTHDLFKALDDLDWAAFEQQRRVTIPFIRSIIDI